jgi:hypothetical protein
MSSAPNHLISSFSYNPDTVTPSVPVTAGGHEAIDMLRSLVFGRACSPQCLGPTEITHYGVGDTPQPPPEGEMTEKQYERTDTLCNRYDVYVKCPNIAGSVLASSATTARLNPVSLRLERCANFVVPRKNDLVCGIVSRQSVAARRPCFVLWFVASDQFQRAVNVILNPEFMYNCRDESEMRSWLFSGNRLMTNSCDRKPYLIMIQNMNNFSDPLLAKTLVDICSQKREKYYVRMRYEEVSRNHVHWVCALVLLLRFGEIPCDRNIPNNNDRECGAVLREWDLPEGWLIKFMERHHIRAIGSVPSFDYIMLMNMRYKGREIREPVVETPRCESDAGQSVPSLDDYPPLPRVAV